MPQELLFFFLEAYFIMKAQVKPKTRGFVCVTAHPEGCAAHVKQQIEIAKNKAPLANGPKNVLILGCSTGYGLASRIAAAFLGNAATLGVCFERPSEKGRPASAGWYNTAAFEQEAKEAGLYAKTINGDAFSKEIKEQTIKTLKEEMGPIDLVVYSLASPRRTDPETGETHKSTLKPIGEIFTGTHLDTDKAALVDVSIEPANPEEVAATVKVMGGEDWELWMEALSQAGILAPNVQTVNYSYLGPEITWDIYKNGTIGKAKEDIEATAQRLNKLLEPQSGKAMISVNKAVVTQASSAIPVVPLYISILFKIMKEQGLHEDCIEQMVRLFTDHLYSEQGPQLDDQGRIRLDDWEMRADIQAAVMEQWPAITTENLKAETDFAGYQENFLRLFGFGLPGINYEEEVELEVDIPSQGVKA